MGAKHLGNLATARPAREDTFDYLDEQTLRVHPDLTDLIVVDFMRKAGGIDEDDERAAMAAMQELFGSFVHPDDFDRFWAAALRGRQTVRDLMGTIRALAEGLSERPTKRRSASSAGRRSTARKSKDDSSARVIRRLEKRGRADLALVVTQAQDARRAG